MASKKQNLQKANTWSTFTKSLEGLHHIFALERERLKGLPAKDARTERNIKPTIDAALAACMVELKKVSPLAREQTTESDH